MWKVKNEKLRITTKRQYQKVNIDIKDLNIYIYNDERLRQYPLLNRIHNASSKKKKDSQTILTACHLQK